MKRRLDLLLVDRGLAPSRERAQALILSGVVLVNGLPSGKAGPAIAEDAEIALLHPDHPDVGRGGVKLAQPRGPCGGAAEGRRGPEIRAPTGAVTA